jgi:hypothetical protein
VFSYAHQIPLSYSAVAVSALRHEKVRSISRLEQALAGKSDAFSPK